VVKTTVLHTQMAVVRYNRRPQPERHSDLLQYHTIFAGTDTTCTSSLRICGKLSAVLCCAACTDNKFLVFYCICTECIGDQQVWNAVIFTSRQRTRFTHDGIKVSTMFCLASSSERYSVTYCPSYLPMITVRMVQFNCKSIILYTFKSYF